MKNLLLLPAILILVFAGCTDNSSSSYDNTEDQAFIEEYSERDDVTITSSGLMYRIIEEGEGEIPDGNDPVIVDYEGVSVLRDRQYGPQDPQRFEIFIPDELNVFPGIGEGIQLMKVGARYEFVIPSNLAEGNGRTYIFDMRLLSYLEQNQEQFLIDNAQLEDVEETSTGLQYRILEEGDGEQPTPSNSVELTYKGTFTSGFVFDQSPEGDTVEFGVTGVIPGFSEGLQLMKEGSKYQFFIPPQLGYGNRYPQYNTVLVFEVELEEVM